MNPSFTSTGLRYYIQYFSKRAGLSLAQGLPELSNAHYERNLKLIEDIEFKI